MYGCLTEIRLHYLLEDSCKALEFSEEALEHGIKARELFKRHYFAMDEDKRTPPRDMLDISADLLEDLGMLKEARVCDHAFGEYKGALPISALRREIEELLRGGFDEVNLHTTSFGNDYTCTHAGKLTSCSRGVSLPDTGRRGNQTACNI
jgi:hypothetical protein